MVIDPTTEKGSKATRWLQDDIVAWLITVAPDGTPTPTPVWFWWDGETLLVYSAARQAEAATYRGESEGGGGALARRHR